MSEDPRGRLRRLADRGTDHADSADAAGWRPTLFRLDRNGTDGLTALLDSGAVRRVHDRLADQLRALVATRRPADRHPAAELERRAWAFLVGRHPADHGTWVWYPWSGTLVHTLPEAEYRELRTARNRHKITTTEQRRLAGTRIGVVGLSVGNAAAVTLALEGIGGAFKIADLDRLELSNLNRIRGRLADLGAEKTVLAARQMFDVDPYLEIERWAGGIRPENVDEFLLGGGKLDLVVEECDDLHLKVLIRERARAHRIPVLMDTSDRGMLDVERFDLEPDRPVFHGLAPSVRAADLCGLAAPDKIPFMLAILDEERLSTRAAACLPEVGHTLETWPQLASGVALGGAVVADTARRLLLGEPVPSGRYYVDPDALVAPGAGLHHTPPTVPTATAGSDAPALPPEPRRGAVCAEAARWIAAVGTLAPSAHNAQPWSLTWRGDAARLECRHDPARDLPSLDFEHGATWVAFGALAENLELASAHLGLRADTRTWPDPDDPALVCTVTLTPGPASPRVPIEVVGRRATNRRRGPRRPLGAGLAPLLEAACAEAGGRLRLLAAEPELAEIGALIGAGDRLSLLNEPMHRDAMAGYRWTPEEARARPYGLDLATAELTGAEQAVFRVLRQWRVMACLSEFGGGRALEDLARSSVAGASAVGLITVPGTARESYLRGGRAMQRLWLAATAHDVALQPMTALPYLFARLERGGGQGLDQGERASLRALRTRYRRLFDTGTDEAEVLLFRLAHVAAPSARSLRRPLDQAFSSSRGSGSGTAGWR
ncbi:molybdopterin/thiamine biosynthesis adenylyltransferase/nitroreductase [Pseudonocardia eucalypti]|uniref:Rv1355c family protein n=1 Tax=Pseudonocardia eucalypti TaxID=648755 RepID=UPI001611F817|nr:molybdopterin/thiamine biosynthesis adenylyltransferase/nitroreductase [Pseudonocardia eucalypti]